MNPLFKEISPEPRKEIVWYLKEKLRKKDEDFLLNLPALFRENQALIKKFLKRRRRGYPFQYLIGNINFFGLDFFIEEGIFIPRPETEILVEEVIKFLNNKEDLLVLDMCTGCGNIGITLSKYLKVKKVYLVDKSLKALTLAKKNVFFQKAKNISLVCADMFSSLKLEVSFDAITINPPYVDYEDIPHLQKELTYEPLEAISAKDKGLEYIKKVITESYNFLKKEGVVFCEIGYNQKKMLEDILKDSPCWNFSFREDFCHIPRVLILEKR